MSTTPKKGTTSTSTSDPEVTRIVSIKDLADRVETLAAQIVSGGGKAPDVSRETSAPAGAGSIDEQVNRAVQAAREKEQAQTAEEERQAAVEDRIKQLESRTERRPTERSRLSKFMWGGDE